jgi:hypothetical protein
MLASRRDNTAIVEVLLANGANPNQAGLVQYTSLVCLLTLLLTIILTFIGRRHSAHVRSIVWQERP